MSILKNSIADLVLSDTERVNFTQSVSEMSSNTPKSSNSGTVEAVEVMVVEEEDFCALQKQMKDSGLQQESTTPYMANMKQAKQKQERMKLTAAFGEDENAEMERLERKSMRDSKDFDIAKNNYFPDQVED